VKTDPRGYRDPLIAPGVPHCCPLCAHALSVRPKQCVYPHNPPLKTTVFLTVEDMALWSEVRPDDEAWHPPLLIPVLCCNCYEIEIERRARSRVAADPAYIPPPGRRRST
jgi:hypothetical protein